MRGARGVAFRLPTRPDVSRHVNRRVACVPVASPSDVLGGKGGRGMPNDTPDVILDGTTFGTELRSLREERGWRQADLGARARFHRTYISKVERGREPPSGEFVRSVLQVFGYDRRLLRLTRHAARHDVSGGRHPAPAGDHVADGLPPRNPHFVGREHQLAAVCGRIRSRSGRACAIVGVPGVGKTSLAVHVAYAVHGEFPGGCLFVDVRGWTRGVLPLRPGEVLGRLLRRLGVPEEEVPASAEDQAAEFRHRTASRGVLLVLDNVRNARQVELLWPDPESSAVLVTSRNRLNGLDAYRLCLRSLPPEPAARLVRSVAGLDGVPEAADGVRRIAERCDGLPLALGLAAARRRPTGPVTPGGIVEALAADAGRHAELRGGIGPAYAEFELSLDTLTPDELDVFTALALQPGTGADATLAATLTGLPVAAARRALESLVGVRLLDRDSTGEYGCHDLVRAMAADRFADALAARSGAWRAELLRRRLDHALRAARAADTWVSPYHRHHPPLPAVPADSPPVVARTFADRASALDWTVHELRTLVDLCRIAYTEGFDEHCWKLAHSLRGVFLVGGNQELWVQSHGWALASAQRLGSHEGEALTLENLGLALQHEHRLSP